MLFQYGEGVSLSVDALTGIIFGQLPHKVYLTVVNLRVINNWIC